MKHEATVVKLNGKYVAQITRTEACGSCNACAFGKKETLHFPLPEGSYTEGERVFVETSDKALYKATLLAYVLPLVCLVGGLVLGFCLFKAEWAQALTGIAGLSIGLIFLKRTEKKRIRSGEYACRAHAADDKAEE